MYTEQEQIKGKDGVSIAVVKASNVPASASDEALVVGISPNSDFATGANQSQEIQKTTDVEIALRDTQTDPTNTTQALRNVAISGLSINSEAIPFPIAIDSADTTVKFIETGFSEQGALNKQHVSTGKILPNANAVDIAIVDANGDQITSFGGSSDATAALQTAGNTSLSSIDTKTPALGQALSANSTPVVLPASQISTLTPPAAITGFALETTQNAGNTLTGAVTETAPATDTASSGLNGRLQRIAQRLTSLLASKGVIGAATAPTNMDLTGGVFNTTPPVLTNGQSASLQLDANSKLRVASTLGSTDYINDVGNGTATQLGSGSTFIGAIASALNYPEAIISIRCDQPYTVNIDQFSDASGTIAFGTTTYTRTAGQAFNQPVLLSGSYYRVRITNNGLAITTTLFAESWLGILPPTPQLDNNGNLPVSLNNSTDASITATTANALNADVFTGDNSNYKSIKVNLTSASFVGTWTVQVANEPTFASPQTGVVYSVASQGFVQGTGTGASVFTIPTNQGRYIRLRVTAFTSGSISATVSGSNVDMYSNSNLLTGQVTKTDRTGTIATANTAQTLMAANANRTGWTITNKSNAIIYINELVTATGGNADYPLMPNETRNYGLGATIPTTSTAISIISSQAGAVFTAGEWNSFASANNQLFVTGTTPQGQAVSANSYPVVLATNSTYGAEKEWKVVTATGTPTAVAGDILLQTIKSNAGTVSTTWFNMTTSVLMTVAPVVANLTENTNKGQTLPGTQNGKQSFFWGSQNLAYVLAGAAQAATFQVVIDGVNGANTNTYTVPTGKRLRITSMNVGGFTSSFQGTSTSKYDEGSFWIAQATTVSITSPIIAMMTWGGQYINPTGVDSTFGLTVNKTFLEGEVDIPGGQQIMFVGKNTNGTLNVRVAGSIQGYLYNA